MDSPARPRVPMKAGYFTVPDDPATPPRLLGSRCEACGEHFFPRRHVCAKCMSRQVVPCELGPRGTGFIWGRTDAWPEVRATVPTFDFADPAVWAAWLARAPLPVTRASHVSPGGFLAYEHVFAVPDAGGSGWSTGACGPLSLWQPAAAARQRAAAMERRRDIEGRMPNVTALVQAGSRGGPSPSPDLR